MRKRWDRVSLIGKKAEGWKQTGTYPQISDKMIEKAVG